MAILIIGGTEQIGSLVLQGLAYRAINANFLRRWMNQYGGDGSPPRKQQRAARIINSSPPR